MKRYETIFQYAEILHSGEHLDQAIQFLLNAHDDDRFSNDPLLEVQFSKRRVVENLRKSYHSWPDEFLPGMFNARTNELIAFPARRSET